MNPSIFFRAIQVLDRHQALTGKKAVVLRLGRTEQRELDDYLLGFMLDRAFGRPTGARPMFDGVEVELADVESCLSAVGTH